MEAKKEPLTKTDIPVDEQGKVPSAEGASVGTVAQLREDARAEKETRTKRKYTRRKSVKEEPAINWQEEFKAFIPVTQVLLNILCLRLPNPIPVSSQESEMVAQALVKVGEKYFPRLVEFAPEIALAGAMVTVILPRAFKDETQESVADNRKDRDRKDSVGEESAAAVQAQTNN